MIFYKHERVDVINNRARVGPDGARLMGIWPDLPDVRAGALLDDLAGGFGGSRMVHSGFMGHEQETRNNDPFMIF